MAPTASGPDTGAEAQLDVLRVFCTADRNGGNPLGVFLDGAAVAEGARQRVAADLGFAETVFVDDRERGELRIFTPEVELGLAGHPLVGTAWLLRERGPEPSELRPPAGEVSVRYEGDLTLIAGDPQWGPPFEFVEVATPAEVEALGGAPEGRDEIGVWAWIDEAAGLIRERVFVAELGVGEDEATGSAAMRLCAQLGREIEIRQGRGSVIYARPLSDGRAEIGGRVVADEVRDYRLAAAAS
jgi:predicted PhzF superfamily epimerase YddE/YHI9